MLTLRDDNGDDSQGQMVRISVGTAYLVILLMLVLRGMSRWPWKTLAGWDDGAAVGVTCASILQGALALVASQHGLGSKEGNGNRLFGSHVLYASELIFILVVFGGRVSTGISLCRLSNLRQYRQRLYTRIILVSCGVLFVVSLVAVGAQPGAPSPYPQGPSSNPTAMIALWAVYVATGSVVDLALIIYPVWLVRNVQMAASAKWKVGVSFGLRIFLIGTAILRMVFIADAAHKNNILYDYAWVAVFTQVEMCTSIVVMTSPCSRAFLLLAQTGLFDVERVASWTTDPSSYSMEPARKPARPTKLQLDKAAKRRSAREERERTEPTDGDRSFLATVVAERTSDELALPDPPGIINVRSKFEVTRSRPLPLVTHFPLTTPTASNHIPIVVQTAELAPKEDIKPSSVDANDEAEASHERPEDTVASSTSPGANEILVESNKSNSERPCPPELKAEGPLEQQKDKSEIIPPGNKEEGSSSFTSARVELPETRKAEIQQAENMPEALFDSEKTETQANESQKEEWKTEETQTKGSQTEASQAQGLHTKVPQAETQPTQRTDAEISKAEEPQAKEPVAEQASPTGPADASS